MTTIMCLVNDNELIIDTDNTCYTYDEFLLAYKTDMDFERPFISPYGSRKHFSDLCPRFLGKHNIDEYSTGKKLLQLALDLSNKI